MGWEDRPYYRDSGNSNDLRSRLRWLVYGSVPLFTAFGIRVRAHSSLIIFIILTMLLGGIGFKEYTFQARSESISILFVIILLHEFGHCFASRWVGGDPDQIMLTPLGGLAMTQAPHRPGATFVTVAGGPLVNVVICILTASLVFILGKHLPWNPIGKNIPHGWLNVYGYAFWIYSLSLALLLFNLLPIFPLDGGQLLQSALWFKLGYYRSMMIACRVGMIGGAVLILIGIWKGELLLVCIALSGIVTCSTMRRMLQESGPESEYGSESMDYSASLRPDAPRKRRRGNQWRARRLRRQAEHEAAERVLIDRILAKVSSKGMISLTWSEKRALRRATERQRRRELEFSRGM